MHPVVLEEKLFDGPEENEVEEASRPFYQQLTQMTFDVLTEEETS
jgi:hypothetical protein